MNPLSQTDIDNNEIAVMELSVEDTVARIKTSASEKNGFDIFQVTAFLYNNPTYGSYWQAALKCAVCLMTQIPALLYLIYEITVKGFEERKAWCEPNKEGHQLWHAYFAFFLASYITLQLFSIYQDTIHGGMYCVYMEEFTNLPDCLSGRWLYCGCQYNSFCLKLAVLASLLTIFFSTQVFDMVLNCVALFFLVQMDDSFVTRKDYKIIENFLKMVTSTLGIIAHSCRIVRHGSSLRSSSNFFLLRAQYFCLFWSPLLR